METYYGADSWMDKKDELHKLGKSILRQVAKDLNLNKGEYSVKSNPAGFAVSGEITLHTERLYIQFSRSSVQIDNKDAFMYRTVKSQKDYTGGWNHWMTYQNLADNYPRAIKIFSVIQYLPESTTNLGSSATPVESYLNQIGA